MGLTPSHIAEYSPEIKTSVGIVRGKLVYHTETTPIDAYLGIPYAKPTIGERRFKKPEPPEPWEGVRDCLNFGPRCPQKDTMALVSHYIEPVGKCEEGCLTLNVIAPREKKDEWPNGYPVMVWVHGGGFAMHSSSNYGDHNIARNLCTKDVIFVSLNYRLGVLGFFTTGDEHCSGNLGLWDQTLALKWVKGNIANFGGDPSNITVFGQSAGGASVDFLSISPHSRDLFQHVIPMGGCAENDFACRTQKGQATLCKQFARKLGWNGDEEDSDDLLAFMREQHVRKLEVGMVIRGFRPESAGPLSFVPVIDGDFLPKSINELRREAPKKSVLAGTTFLEGLLFCVIAGMGGHDENSFKKTVRRTVRHYDYGESTEQLRNDLMDFYAQELALLDKEKSSYRHIELLSDSMINNGMVSYANKMAALGNDVYFYSFDYHNPNGFGLFGYFMPFKAATHAYELRFVLGKGIFNKFRPDENDLKMVHVMTTYFTNFAKFGNPLGRTENEANVIWSKHSPDHPYRYMRIDLEKTGMAENYQDQRAQFWKQKIYPKNSSRALCIGEDVLEHHANL